MGDRRNGRLEVIDLQTLGGSGDEYFTAGGETESEEEILFSSTSLDRNSTRSLLNQSPSNKLNHVLDNGTRQGKTTLRKELNVINGVTLIVGSIIGSGIFISPKIVLCHSGSFGASMIAWLIGGFIALAGALCYVELGLLVRTSGGDYSFLLEAYSFNRKNKLGTTLGGCVAFLYVWSTVFIIRPGSYAILALTCSHYLSQPFFIGCVVPETVVKLVALSVVVSAAILNAYSVRLTGLVITVVTTLKLFAVAFIAILGIAIVISRQSFPEDAQHLFEPREGFELTASDLALAFYGVLWAYDGWSIIFFAFEETKNVQKTLPRSLFIGIPIVAICYLLVNVAYFGVLSYDQILTGDAVALTFGNAALGKVGLVVIPLMVALSTSGASVGSVYAGSRLAYVAGRDGMLPALFSGLHTDYKTPIPAILLHAIVGSLYVIIGDISQLLNGLSAAIYVFFTLIFISLIIMRFTRSREPRLFKAWFIVPISIFSILASLFLTFLPMQQKPVPSLLAFGIILTGLPVYFFIVMETPWKLRPTILDLISDRLTKFTNGLLNTQSAR